MRIVWATDVHVNFLDPEGRRAFGRELVRTRPDAVILSGDISEAPAFADDLGALAEEVRCPLYFVLGNHDFYRGSIGAMRALARRLPARWPRVRWLPASGVVRLGGGVALVGVDGWGDGRAGDPEGTGVMLNDFAYIDELAGLPRPALLAKVRALGDEEARLAARLLDEALADFRHLLFVTHVPPFVEACWHEGEVSNDEWLPWFTCVSLGRVLRGRLAAERRCEATVLCGHTHGAGFAQILPNLRAYTGGAEYGAPRVAGLVEIGPGGVRVVPG
ncbi:MAG TPA: metallophosphoesterase [Polyangiaceae bacterium]|nr:metallophosphoesterase [Polyangiaceae bacterium]